MRIRNWATTYSQLNIYFEERLTNLHIYKKHNGKIYTENFTGSILAEVNAPFKIKLLFLLLRIELSLA